MNNKKKILFFLSLALLLISCSQSKNSFSTSNNTSSLPFVGTSSSSNNEKDTNTSSNNGTNNSNETSTSFKEVESSQLSTSSNTSSSSQLSTSSSISSSSSKESIKYTFMDGNLYGDINFIQKCKDVSLKREVETVDDIPIDAIYVSNDGSDSNNGNINTPFKTLTKAAGLIKSRINANKDVYIILRGGTYSYSYLYDLAIGNENHYIVITNYPNEIVKFSGDSSENGLLHLGHSKYLIIEGLIFCDSTSNLKKANAIGTSGKNLDHIIIKNNEFYNIRCDGTSGNAPIISFRGSDNDSSINNVLIYNNNLHDCQTGWSEAIAIAGNCEYFNIINNKVTNTGNIGIDIAGNWSWDAQGENNQARYVIVRGNDVSNCNSLNARSYALYVDGARDVIFEYNKAYNSQGGIEIGCENIVPTMPVKNIIVRNNVVYNNSEQGIQAGGYNPTKSYYCYNIEIYNNTIVNNGEKISGQFKYAMLDGMTFKNNILYSSNNYSLVSSELDNSYAKNMIFDNNLYYGGVVDNESFYKPSDKDVTGFSKFKEQMQETGFYADPLFVDVNNYDFRLLKNSPAINKGKDVVIEEYDIGLNNRLNGIIDIGAYEY